jgi:hypothetical protein
MRSIPWAITFVIGIGIGIWSVSPPSRLPHLDASLVPPSSPCMTSFVMDSVTSEVILVLREKQKVIEVMHVPRPSALDWTICYGPACLPLDTITTYIVTKERQ